MVFPLGGYLSDEREHLNYGKALTQSTPESSHFQLYLSR